MAMGEIGVSADWTPLPGVMSLASDAVPHGGHTLGDTYSCPEGVFEDVPLSEWEVIPTVGHPGMYHWCPYWSH